MKDLDRHILQLSREQKGTRGAIGPGSHAKATLSLDSPVPKRSRLRASAPEFFPTLAIESRDEDEETQLEKSKAEPMGLPVDQVHENAIQQPKEFEDKKNDRCFACGFLDVLQNASNM